MKKIREVSDSTKTKQPRREGEQAEPRPVSQPVSATDCPRGSGQHPAQYYLSSKGEGAIWEGQRGGQEDKGASARCFQLRISRRICTVFSQMRAENLRRRLLKRIHSSKTISKLVFCKAVFQHEKKFRFGASTAHQGGNSSSCRFCF